MPNSPDRGRRGSLRLRLTVLATTVAAIPLVAAAIALADSLRAQLYWDAVGEAREECVITDKMHFLEGQTRPG